MFQKAFTQATRAIKKGAVFFHFEELLPKFLESKKIWFLYHTSLFLGFYYIAPGKFKCT